MSKPAINIAEPADRLAAMGLSTGEMYALILHHEKQIRAITRRAIKMIGEAALKEPIIPQKRDIKYIRQQHEQMIENHRLRAGYIARILKEALEKNANEGGE